MSQDQKETKKNSGRGFLSKWKPWIDKKKIWLIIAIIIAIIAELTLYYIFPSLFFGIIEVCLIFFVLYIVFPNFFTRKNLSEFFTIDNLTSPIGDLSISIEQLIKILLALGLILLIHFVFAEVWFLKFITYIFERLNLHQSTGYTIGGILGFTAILWGLHLTNKRLDAFREQIEISNRQLDASYKHNLEDRFIRSVELTGNKNLAIRLGGLAGLQALTHENAKMYIRVWEYLGSFLRNPPDLEGWVSFPEVREIGHSKIEKEILVCSPILNQETSSTQDTRSDQNGENKIRVRPDISHIAKILREQNEQQQKWKKEENFYLPLNEIHLEGADLSDAHLERADLRNAHLEGATLSDANLERADLRNAHLEGATLLFAYLEQADLRNAHLKGADLTFVYLERANLGNALLERVYLSDAELKGADLSHAQLKGADLSHAQLDGTILTGTDLRKAQNLTSQQIEDKNCRYQKGFPPLLPEEWPQDQRDRVLASMRPV